MRSLSLMVPASLLLLAASHSGAQTQAQAQTQTQTEAYPLTEPEQTSRVQVTAPPRAFQFWEYEAEFISGAYAMSNGWHMKVDPSSDGIVAQIDKERPMRLVAVSENKYASRDGNVWMEFNRGTGGGDMLMSYVPNTRTAQVIVVTATARLAQR
jgi:hypothetical protein